MLLHLGTNMWEQEGKMIATDPEGSCFCDTLRFDLSVFHKVTEAMAQNGFNTVVIDIADGILYDSHPEIAVKNALTKAELKKELERLRKMGLDPIPKLNFSTTHSAWLKSYAYMVGTDKYYDVCRDLIEEVIDLFDTPKLFHLGLEEEDYASQKTQPVAIVRAPYKKCEDANFMFDICRNKGVRPWIWADLNTVNGFGGEAAFRTAVDKDVLLSNWEYRKPFRATSEFEHYINLGEWGYEQVPTSSISGWHCNNFDTLNFCKNCVDESSIVGYMEAPWEKTVERRYYALMNNVVNFRYAWDDVYGEGK